MQCCTPMYYNSVYSEFAVYTLCWTRGTVLMAFCSPQEDL